MDELALKTGLAAEAARSHDLGGVLFASPPGFAWITGGGTNRIDVTRDAGAGALFVTADGLRFLIANNIEMPRLASEAATGDEAVEFTWTAERADPRLLASTASRLSGGHPVGADAVIPGTTLLDAPLAALRAPLTAEEIDRYRRLGRDAGAAVGAALRSCQPGMLERDVTAEVAGAVARIGARSLVLLAGADDRLERFRHPIPTDRPWQRTIMVAVCAERGGMVVALSRVMSAGAAPAALADRTLGTAYVFSELVTATHEGRTGREMFEVARRAYAAAGFPGEERLHHQGGAIGYRSREWVAHPASRDVVQAPQAFAWNPSITGTKTEDTILLTGSGAEVITASPAWPALTVGLVTSAGVLER